MEWGGPFFVLGIIAICQFGWIVTTAIRAKHGYPVSDDWGGKVDHPTANRHVELLESENAALRGKLGRVEERISVLERIATDKGTRLSAEIETLRADGR